MSTNQSLAPDADEARREMDRALTALFLAVREDIARDVRAKVEAVVQALERENERLRKELHVQRVVAAGAVQAVGSLLGMQDEEEQP